MTLISKIHDLCGSSKGDSRASKVFAFACNQACLPSCRAPTWKIATVGLTVYGFHSSQGALVYVESGCDHLYSIEFETHLSMTTYIRVQPHFFIYFSHDGTSNGFWKENERYEHAPSHIKTAMKSFMHYVDNGGWTQKEFLRPRSKGYYALALWAVRDCRTESSLVWTNFVGMTCRTVAIGLNSTSSERSLRSLDRHPRTCSTKRTYSFDINCEDNI